MSFNFEPGNFQEGILLFGETATQQGISIIGLLSTARIFFLMGQEDVRQA